MRKRVYAIYRLSALILFLCSSLALVAHSSSLAFSVAAQSSNDAQSSATVKNNPINTWLQQLKEKETALFLREQKASTQSEELKSILTARENKLLLVLVLVSSLSLCLVIINFYFDYRRRQTH